MNKIFYPVIGAGLFLLASTSQILAQAQKVDKAKITVDVNKPGHIISPTLFGIFFEDINLSADGGLYPELVRNRSFEDADSLQYWKFTSVDAKAKLLSSKQMYNHINQYLLSIRSTAKRFL